MRMSKFMKALLGGDTLTSDRIEEAFQGWVPVESSNIARIRYTDVLEVEFKNGSRYEYQAPVSEFQRLQEAPSVGKYLNSTIKGSYPYRQTRPKWSL